jgi:hypothetical protein
MNEALHPRLAFDLRARRQVFGDGDEIEIPAGSEAFWRWFAGTVRCGRRFRLVPRTGVPEYPPGDGRCALWFSGGVESTYTLEHVRSESPVLMRIEDHPIFSGEDRSIGQIHFLCVALSAAKGFGRTYLGVERNDLLLAANPHAQRYVERTPSFLAAWSRYQPGHRASSVCSRLHKEEIIRWLHARRIAITGTCDRPNAGRWCGNCYKCFEAFYTAKAIGIDLGFALTAGGFDRYLAEYRRYVASEFADNYNNAYAHYVRLQITYGLRFERDHDVRA